MTAGLRWAPVVFPGDVDAHSDGESPRDGDVGVAALIEEDVHGDDAAAEHNQDQGAEEFGDELSGEPVLHRYRILDSLRRGAEVAAFW